MYHENITRRNGDLNPQSAELFLHKPWGPTFFQFDIIINVLVSLVSLVIIFLIR